MSAESKRVVRRNGHMFARGGEVVAVLSLLLLVPFLRHRREQRHSRWHGRWHGRFLILGH